MTPLPNVVKEMKHFLKGDGLEDKPIENKDTFFYATVSFVLPTICGRN